MDVRRGSEQRAVSPLDVIIEEHWGSVEAVCRMRLSGMRAADVDDAVQDTFVEFLVADRERIIDVRSWLLAVAVRMCGHIHRRRYRRAEVPLSTDAFDDEGDPSAIAVNELAFCKLIACLPASEQQLMTWRYVEQLSYQQLGLRLGISDGHARILAFRARHRIRDALTHGELGSSLGLVV